MKFFKEFVLQLFFGYKLNLYPGRWNTPNTMEKEANIKVHTVVFSHLRRHNSLEFIISEEMKMKCDVMGVREPVLCHTSYTG